MEPPRLNAILEMDFDGINTAINYQDDFTSGLSVRRHTVRSCGWGNNSITVSSRSTKAILFLNCEVVQLLERVKLKPQDKQNRITNPCVSCDAVKLSYRLGAKSGRLSSTAGRGFRNEKR